MTNNVSEFGPCCKPKILSSRLVNHSSDIDIRIEVMCQYSPTARPTLAYAHTMTSIRATPIAFAPSVNSATVRKRARASSSTCSFYGARTTTTATSSSGSRKFFGTPVIQSRTYRYEQHRGYVKMAAVGAGTSDTIRGDENEGNKNGVNTQEQIARMKNLKQGDDPELDKKYASFRVRTFYSIFVGYATFYLTRNSLTFTAQAMRTELGLSMSSIGILLSVFPMSYGVCKMIAGVLADKFSSRKFMAFGLIMTGVINIMFGFSKSMTVFIILWIANGFFQAAGAPPCAKLLTNWYSKSERGTWWGFWNTSHNTGGFIIPLLASFCVRNFGWQYGMIVPGTIAIIMGLFLYNRLRDSPESIGLPPVDSYRNEPDNGQVKVDSQVENDDDGLSTWQRLRKFVLSNPYVWLLAVSYFFIYFVRAGVSSWSHVFLQEFRGISNFESAFRVSGLEVGGLLGSLVSGWASDKMMRGRRIPVIIMWLIGVIASVGAFWFIPAPWRYVHWLAVFSIGFFIYGPQMLVGLAGAEIVDRSAVSSTIGLLGWIAYAGAAVSGYPLTKFIGMYGWGAYFVSLLSFAAMAVLLLLPMWRLGMKAKPAPEPAVLPDTTPISPIPVQVTGSLMQCRKCGGTGSVFTMICGPATADQTLSCKVVDVSCPECIGSGYLSRMGAA